MSGSFWLTDWMNEREIRSNSAIGKAVAEPGFINEMMERALRADVTPELISATGRSVLGGRGLDLSGEIDGADTPGLIAEVDAVFGSLWHYFDEIVVEGFTPRRFLLMCQDRNFNLARIRVQSHCAAILHLRDIGALDHLTFLQKPNPCTRHGEHGDLLRQHGLDRILASGPVIIEQLGNGELHELVDHGDHFHYEYEHRLLGFRSGALEWGLDAHDYDDDYEIAQAAAIRHIAEDVFRAFAEYVAADVAAAQQLDIPLAYSPILRDTVVDQVTPRLPAGGAENEVLAEVGLPVLRGVCAADIIAIRSDEGDAFERFRNALRFAIREQLKELKSEGELPVSVARTVVEDVISPAIHDIAQRLNIAKNTLTKKSGVNITIGTVSVAVGLVAAMPLLAPAGIALSLAAPGVHYAKYLDEKADIQLSDMYFAWKAQRLAGAL